MKIKNIIPNKKAQLGWIEFKYLAAGFIIGLILGLALAILSAQGILPFKLPGLG